MSDFAAPARAGASFADWGSDLTATVFHCDELPGGLGEIDIKSHSDGEPFRFRGKVVEYKTIPCAEVIKRGRKQP